MDGIEVRAVTTAEYMFTMGEVSSMLGVTPQTIRLYEKFNEPKRYWSRDNGYRCFPFESVAQLFTFRELATMGTPLPEVARLVSSLTADDALGSMAAAVERVEDELRRLRRLKSCIAEHESFLRRIGDLDEFHIETMPTMYRLACGSERPNPVGKDGRALIQSWGEQVPFVFFSGVMHNMDSLGDYATTEAGLAVVEAFSDLVDISDPAVEKIGSCKCVGGTVRASRADVYRKEHPDGYASYKRAAESMLAFAKKNGLRPLGNGYSRLILAGVQEPDGTVSDYYYGWMPVE